MVLALIVAAIGGGVLLAKNMGALPGLSNSPVPATPAADRNGVSDADKSKADNVVGPQGVAGGSQAATPANDPSVVTINAPAGSPAGAPPDVAVPVTQVAPAVSAPPEPPPPVKLPQIQSSAGAGTESGLAPPNPAPNPVPKPVKPRPPARSGGPSLDDLLD